jgi:hypothetical protein
MRFCHPKSTELRFNHQRLERNRRVRRQRFSALPDFVIELAKKPTNNEIKA